MVEFAADVASDSEKKKCLALISVSHAPDVYKFLPPKMGQDHKENTPRLARALPAGVPKLFLAGSLDSISSAGAMQGMLALMSRPAELKILDGARFTMRGEEKRVAQLAVEVCRVQQLDEAHERVRRVTETLRSRRRGDARQARTRGRRSRSYRRPGGPAGTRPLGP